MFAAFGHDRKIKGSEDPLIPVPLFVTLSPFGPEKFPARWKRKLLVLLALEQWALQDLNLRPTDYESAALTN